MSSNIQITPAQLSRLVGLPDAPVLLDVRIDEDVAADPRLLPASERRSHRDVAAWAGAYAGRRVVVMPASAAQKLSAGHRRLAAPCSALRPRTLAGGFEAWKRG
jgi:rhodanese-related sulfurtransferase